MFAGNIRLFEIFGFEVKVNVSWTFIALLIAWSLAQGYFPAVYQGLPVATYWWMGIAGVFGLFLSIILHELAHSLVGRAYGIEIKGITLWLLGGVAELEDEPSSPRAELLMALAGPLVSVVLAAYFRLRLPAHGALAHPKLLAACCNISAFLTSFSRSSICFQRFRWMAVACCARVCGDGMATGAGRRASPRGRAGRLA
ncbi:putative zinc metalloprotease Rip3 [bacterium MnTg02]|nr:putative zinc metalloprotease Rip3 [bacterium MnTg02]